MMLLLHALMLSLLSGGSAEVVLDFENNCDKFFANKIPPTRFPGSQYKQICQTLYDDVHYATYYDTYNKTPVYSAYKFVKETKQDITRSNWFIEPQLGDMNIANMTSEGSLIKDLQAGVNDKNKPNMELKKEEILQRLGKHQALNRDYVKSEERYHKGHLVPVFHAPSQLFSDATFTLTSAAPQNSSFNQGQWRVLEKYIAGNLSEKCLPDYSVYIVTGVVPGEEKMNKTVTVPSHFWTAYCCLDQNKKCKISRGFIGENKNNTPLNITVNELEDKLEKLYGKPFEVFGPTSRKRQRDKEISNELSNKKINLN